MGTVLYEHCTEYGKVLLTCAIHEMLICASKWCNVGIKKSSLLDSVEEFIVDDGPH